MSIKRYYSNAWQNVNSVKRYSSGAWSEVNAVHAYKNGTWYKIYPDTIFVNFYHDISPGYISYTQSAPSAHELEIAFKSNTQDSSMYFWYSFSNVPFDIEVEFISVSGYSPDDDFYIHFLKNGQLQLTGCFEAGKISQCVTGIPSDTIVVCGSQTIYNPSELTAKYGFSYPSDIEWTFKIRSTNSRFQWS